MTVAADNVIDYKQELLKIAGELAKQGPGYAQEGVLLRAAQKEFNAGTLPEQQKILDAWHQLFLEGTLIWGYDIDNPSAPWFHFPRN